MASLQVPSLLPDTPHGWLTAGVASVALALLLLNQERGDVAGEAQAEDGGAEAPSCRICFAGLEAGRLFRPCRCRGTMAHVHPECLNEWRARSANTRSFFKCDQCGFEYRVQRTQWADALQSEALVSGAAAALLGLLILLGAIASAAAEFRCELWLYETAFWDPRVDFEGWWGWRCDRLVAGAMLPAGVGLVRSIFERARHALRGGVEGAFLLLGLSQIVLNLEAMLSPALLFICVLYTFAHTIGALKAVAKGLLARFGEIVLEYV